MKAFEIFRKGKQTASDGTTLEFGEDLLAAAVAAYDPALHEAPIVVGHPKDNHPAFGWIKSLSYADGVLTAEPDQVDPEFAELVQAGRYKKRSASFYLPDAPNNPKPGTLYLRHVGFLGAQPPAVKGLKGVEFNDTEEGVVEFSDSSSYSWSLIAGAFRGLREWFIAEKGLETADKLVPSYYIDELNAEAERKRNARDAEVMATPAIFNESQQGEPNMKTAEELQAELDVANARVAELEAKEAADFAEKAAAAEAAAKEADRVAVGAKIDELIAQGRVLPAERSQLVDYAASLQDAETVIEFGEGDEKQAHSQRGFFIASLAARPVAVDFKERSRRDDSVTADEMADDEVASKARELVKAGECKNFSEAVAKVRSGSDK